MSDLIFKTGGTEIEKTKKEIEVLTAKLKLLEEIENHKSPAEIAYKKVYGAYPMGEPSMINCIIEGNPPDGYLCWSEWYNELGSKGILHNLKISANKYQPTPEEPEELKTLYDVLLELDKPMFTDDVCSAVKRWMSQYADNVMCGEYKKGYEYCLTVLEENLK